MFAGIEVKYVDMAASTKNMILVILALGLIVVGGLWTWQRTTVQRLEGDNARLNTAFNEQIKTITELQANLDKVRISQAQMQRIEKATGDLRERIKKIDSKIPIGGQYETSLAADISTYFNTGVLPISLQGDSDASGGEILSGSSKADLEPAKDVTRIGR